MRTLGLGLGSLCVGSVFWLHDEPWFLWVLLALYVFVWPHVANFVALRSAEPSRWEFRNLALDSALGGVWIALMNFNLLPSVLLLTMLTVDKIAAGGIRLALPTTSLLFITCLVTSAALGFPLDVSSPNAVIVACIPFLVTYPLAVSNVMYALQNTVARQNRRLLQISSTDELTGLANRREGFAAAEHALERHRRSGAPAVLIVLDIDRFKRVNDRWGHPAGDQVLCGVANMLRQCSRASMKHCFARCATRREDTRVRELRRRYHWVKFTFVTTVKNHPTESSNRSDRLPESVYAGARAQGSRWRAVPQRL